jgi:hypothetical protein
VHSVRRLLQSAFGFLALVFLSAAYMTLAHLPHFLTALSHHLSSDNIHGVGGWRLFASLVLLVLSVLIMCAPIPLTALYSMAWWTLHQGKPSGRLWALAASIITVLQGIPILALTLRYWDRIHGILSEGFLILIGIHLLVGIPGIIAFAPRNAAGPLALQDPERIKGDGTSRKMDRFAILLQVAVILLGGQLGWHWARSRFDHRIAGTGDWVLWFSELSVIVIIHELGHIVAGLFCGMQLGGVLLGPLHFHQSNGKWNFRFERGFLSGAAGAVLMIPRTPNRDRMARICFIAGGPVASLISGIAFLYWATAIPNGQSEILSDFCLWSGIFSLSAFVLNLIPVRSQALYSDGAQIYQVLARSVLDDYYWLLSFNRSLAVTPNRPRDYDLAALRRTADSEVGRPLRVVFRLMETECLLERGLFEESAGAVAKAQAAYAELQEKMGAGSICTFVIGHAILCSDLATARVWAAQLEEGFGFSADDRWLCDAALACAEGRRSDAETGLDEFERFQRGRRPCGSREFNLFLAGFLRGRLVRCLDAAADLRALIPVSAELVQHPA